MIKRPMAERAEGKMEEIGGTVEKNVGRLVGNERVELKGRAKELEGQTRQETVKAGERARGVAEELAGTVEKNVGRLVGNERVEVEGKVKELKGQARQKTNRARDVSPPGSK